MKTYIIALIAITAIFLFFALNPLRRSATSIEDRLYRITPLGTSYETATNKLSKDFGHISFSDKTGFMRHDWPAPPELVGTKSIEVYLGEYYQFPAGKTGVAAYWGFDNKDRLIEIWVRKDTDSI
jgi:hypothetical protein